MNPARKLFLAANKMRHVQLIEKSHYFNKSIHGISFANHKVQIKPKLKFHYKYTENWFRKVIVLQESIKQVKWNTGSGK